MALIGWKIQVSGTRGEHESWRLGSLDNLTLKPPSELGSGRSSATFRQLARRYFKERQIPVRLDFLSLVIALLTAYRTLNLKHWPPVTRYTLTPDVGNLAKRNWFVTLMTVDYMVRIPWHS